MESQTETIETIQFQINFIKLLDNKLFRKLFAIEFEGIIEYITCIKKDLSQ